MPEVIVKLECLTLRCPFNAHAWLRLPTAEPGSYYHSMDPSDPANAAMTGHHGEKKSQGIEGHGEFMISGSVDGLPIEGHGSGATEAPLTYFTVQEKRPEPEVTSVNIYSHSEP